jgi:16S rRNA (cytidine1402-2'-O)-methyltransferase
MRTREGRPSDDRAREDRARDGRTREDRGRDDRPRGEPAAVAPARTFSIDARTLPAPALAPGLYIVATPIGHLGDMTLRGLATLAAADLIACEDTRVTRVLTERYGIRTPTIAYHEHNAGRQRPRLLADLLAGRSVALVSDAGTPLISDPGYRLVAEVAALGLPVFPIPGPSALLAALVVAGLPTDTVLFAGFLPQKGGPRRRRIEELGLVPATLVLYESPHRVAETLADLVAILGADRPAVVARELTKLYETVVRAPLGELAERFAGAPPKGEIVLVIGPPLERETSEADADALLVSALATMSASAAAGDVARATGLDRRELYRRALELKGALQAEDGDDAADGRDDGEEA